MSQSAKGFVLVFFSALSFSVLPIMGKVAYALGIGPMNLLAWRFIMAALVLWPLMAIFFREKLKVKGLDLLHFAIQGVLGYGLASICFFKALTYLNASLVSVLLYTYPSLVALLSRVIYKEKLPKTRIIVIFTTFLGTMLVTNLLESNPGRIAWQGIAFGLLASLAYSIFNLYSQKTTSHTHPMVVSAYSISSIAILSFFLVPRHEFFNITLPLLGISSVIGVVSTVLPIGLYLSGIKLIGASRAAVVSTFEPVFTILFAFALLGESLTISQTVGALLVFSGVIALQVYVPKGKTTLINGSAQG